MSVALDFCFIILCILGSTFFSMSEAVIMTIGIDRGKQLMEGDDSMARAMRFMVEKSNEILSTILIGNTIVNIFAGSIATTLATEVFGSHAVGLMVGITTILILIVGEILPKTFGRSYRERLAVPLLAMLKVVYFLLWPVVKSTTFLTQSVLGEKAVQKSKMITRDDLEYMVNRAEADKSIDSKQLDYLSSILEFPTIKVKDVMIPRSQVKFIKDRSSYDEILQMIRVDTHSRYPVCKESMDNAFGFLHIKDLAFVSPRDQQHFSISKYIKPPFFVYEHMKIQAVFDHMNRKKIHLALVKDENGIVVGIITLEDIIEEIVGEIHDEHDQDEEQKEIIHDQGLILEGSALIRDINSDLDLKIPTSEEYSTLAGFMLDLLGNNFPKQGQLIVWEGLSFELLRVENFTIRKVRIKDPDGERHLFSSKGQEGN